MKPGVPNSDVHKNLKMEKWRKIKKGREENQEEIAYSEEEAQVKERLEDLGYM